MDFLIAEKTDIDAKKVAVWVFFGSHGSYHKYVDAALNECNECPIALIPMSTKTNWDALDGLVWRAFKVRRASVTQQKANSCRGQ